MTAEKELATLMDKKRKEIESLLPKNISPNRMYRTTLMEINKNPKLAKCQPLSIWNSVLEAAQLRLEIGNSLGQCYLIPRPIEGELICQFQLGYRGIQSLLQRSKFLSFVPIPELVYHDDEFYLEKGANPKLIHIPNIKSYKEEENIIGGYVVVNYKNGAQNFFYMSRQQIDKIMHSSPSYRAGLKKDSYRDTPWFTHKEDMIRKTIGKKIFKYCPIDAYIQRALENDNLCDAGKWQSTLIQEKEIEIGENPILPENMKTSKAGDLLKELDNKKQKEPLILDYDTEKSLNTISKIINEI